MNNRFMTILFSSLTLLMAVLFVLACGLNRKQYLSNIQTIKADSAAILIDEGRHIRDRLRTVEREAFARFEQRDPPPTWQRTNMLFRREDNRFVPLGIAPPGNDSPAPGERNADDGGAADAREAWTLSEAITQLATNRTAPFRMPYDDFILSVNARNQAYLLPLDLLRRDDASGVVPKVTTTAPGAAAADARQLNYPPVHVWIPAGQFDARKQAVEQAYRLTQAMLGILLGAMICLGFAIRMLVKRQHEMTLLKSAFISSVSHELRTPMALIRLYAESLTANQSPPAAKDRYSRAIMAETDRLIALLNNVLDFSRLEKGALVMDVRNTDLSTLLTQVLESFKFRLEKEGLTLASTITPGMTALVDPLAMTQVIFNLVDNAIKYSGGQSPLEVELVPAGKEIVLRVKDRGIGIPDSLKPRIGLPFVRGDDSRVTAQRGSGIGLSVVTQLLEGMHGAMRVNDNSPRGTVIEVRVASASVAT